MELISEELKFAIVYHSNFTKNNASFVVYESKNHLIVEGACLFSDRAIDKEPELGTYYFLVLLKDNMEIIGFFTCMENEFSIQKLKKRIQKIPTIVGKDSRSLYDTMKKDISNRTIERCVLNANFYGGRDPEDIKEFTSEQLKNIKQFIQI